MKIISEKRPTTLAFVGTGINSTMHITPDAIYLIQTADKVFFTVTDPACASAIIRLNPSACSLAKLYSDGKSRHQTYTEMTNEIMQSLRNGYNTTVAFYGHPTVLVTTAIECIRQARSEGFAAFISPGISSECCLYADLCFDPGEHGYQSYEATYLLIYKKYIDCTTPLVLWQIGGIGEISQKVSSLSKKNILVLIDYLLNFYESNHFVALYEASCQVNVPAKVAWFPLCQLSLMNISAISTLFVPPSYLPNLDEAMLTQLKN